MDDIEQFRLVTVNHAFGEFHTLVERKVNFPKLFGIIPQSTWVLDKVCKDRKEAAEFVESQKGCIQ